jgi:hypothetical protein
MKIPEDKRQAVYEDEESKRDPRKQQEPSATLAWLFRIDDDDSEPPVLN